MAKHKFHHAPLTILILTTLFFALLALFVRAEQETTLDAGLEVVTFDFHTLGLALQELLIPLALLYLLSNLPLFERVLTSKTNESDNRNLILALIGIQTVAFAINWALDSAEAGFVTFGLLLPIVAGLLGGLRAGFAIGFISMLLHAVRLVQQEWIVEPYILIDGGSFFDLLLWLSLLNLAASIAIWVGIVAGTVRYWLGDRCFDPKVLFGLGVVLEFIPAVLIYAAYAESEALLERLPIGLAVGLALVVFGLMVRQVQGRIVRQQANAAELALVQAELRALRAQINPHFLFNSLNTILYFVRTNPDTGYKLLENLSELFQNALTAGEFVLLADELRYVRAYLALEQARLEDRLQVEWSVDESIVSRWHVPTLILQPIVENGVKHGIAPQPNGGTLHITIQAEANGLLMCVEDSGGGFDTANVTATNHGIGLANVCERLAALYGSSEQLQIMSQSGKGTRVEVRIPK
ncbi:MAG: histidine kinase [Chloroflexota bacterium]